MHWIYKTPFHESDQRKLWNPEEGLIGEIQDTYLELEGFLEESIIKLHITDYCLFYLTCCCGYYAYCKLFFYWTWHTTTGC